MLQLLSNTDTVKGLLAVRSATLLKRDPRTESAVCRSSTK